MRVRVVVALVCGIVLAGCTGNGESQGQRVDLEDLLAFETPLPDDVVGVDLGDVVPTPETFCEAAATVSNRWIDDALFPMQHWRDTYASIPDAPAVAQPSIARLMTFVERRLRWSLTGEGDRPIVDDELRAEVATLAQAGIESCPDLPPVVGLPGTSDKPSGWDDLTEEQVVEHCAGIARGVEEGIAEFVEVHGRQPRHQIEMEPMLELFVSSDWHGVTLDADGQAIVVPVPGGGCDL